MISKQIDCDDQTIDAIQRGVHKFARLIRASFGPAGRPMTLARSGGTFSLTRDGATIAETTELEDPVENRGAQLLRAIAIRTSDAVGDGASTAAIYAQIIFAESLKGIMAGLNIEEIRSGVAKAVAVVSAELRFMSRAVKSTHQLTEVATISADGDLELAEVIAKAVNLLERDGLIRIEESQGRETQLQMSSDMQFAEGYLSEGFVTDVASMTAVIKEPWVLLIDGTLARFDEVAPLLDEISRSGRSLLIIAHEVEDDALNGLVAKHAQGPLSIAAVRTPRVADQRAWILKDIAAITGAQVVSQRLGTSLENLKAVMLGSADRAIVERAKTTLVGRHGHPQVIAERAESVRREMATAMSDVEKTTLRVRLARLTGDIAVIRVGVETESELQERKARARKAVRACRAAVEQGVLPGGGVAALRARSALHKITQWLAGDESAGVDAVRQALVAPLRQIAANAGYAGSVVLQKVEEHTEPGFAFNAATGQYGDLFEMRIIVPTKVELTALENAASVIDRLLTTEGFTGYLQKRWQQ